VIHLTFRRIAMSRIRTFALLALLLTPASTALVAQAVTADVVVIGGRIYTADAARPIVNAMAIRNGRVVFAGDAAGARALAGANTRVVDLAGRTVIPGMTDAHAHVVGLGETLRSVNLVGTRSYAEVIARVVERARTTPKGEWILGRGWDQNDWGNTAWPTHDELSRAVPDHPVSLSRVDGHAALVNTAAMRLAGLTRASRDPAGGEIIRTASGEPTGILVDNAENLVGRVIPNPTRAQVKETITAAIAEMHRWGLTGVHDAGASAQHQAVSGRRVGFTRCGAAGAVL
jgi:predicted amidohydrolase YtcJ